MKRHIQERNNEIIALSKVDNFVAAPAGKSSVTQSHVPTTHVRFGTEPLGSTSLSLIKLKKDVDEIKALFVKKRIS